MPNAFTRIALFLSSYVPLFLIRGIRSWLANRRLALVLIAVSVFALLVLWAFLRTARTLALRSGIARDVLPAFGRPEFPSRRCLRWIAICSSVIVLYLLSEKRGRYRVVYAVIGILCFIVFNLRRSQSAPLSYAFSSIPSRSIF